MIEQKSKIKEIITAGEAKLISSEHKQYAIFEQANTHFLYHEQAYSMHFISTHFSLVSMPRIETKISVTKSTEEVYVPMPKSPFAPIEDPLPYNSIDDLFNEIKQFVYDHVDFTDASCYDVIAAFVLASWRAEEFDTAPYILFLGDYGTGKTRALEILQQLAYRGIASASISAPALVRLLQKYRVTMLIDETELLNNESRQELVAILNSGYKKGQFYIRAQHDGPEIELWNTYGFKALAGTQDFIRTLTSRCIIIPMERNTREVSKSIDKSKALEIRRKLLCYRFENLCKDLPYVDVPFSNGRNIELFNSLIRIAPESARQCLISYGLNLEAQAYTEESTSFEADIVKAIVALKKERVKASEILDFLVANRDLDQPEVKQIQSLKNRIGRIIKNKFHFQKNTQKEFFIDKEKLGRLQCRYLYLQKSDKTVKTDNSNTNEISDLSDLSVFQGVRIALLIDIAKALGTFSISDIINECQKARLELTEDHITNFLKSMNRQGRVFAEAPDKWRFQG